MVLALLGGGVFATPHLVLTIDKDRKRRGDGVTANHFPMPVGRKGSNGYRYLDKVFECSNIGGVHEDGVKSHLLIGKISRSSNALVHNIHTRALLHR